MFSGKLFPKGYVKSLFVNASYTLFQCNNCRSRLFDQNEHPEINLEQYYNAYAESQNFSNNKFRLSSYWSHEVKLIKKIYGSDPGSILDVGCQTGDFLLHWQEGVKRMGVEISDISASIAKSRNLDIIKGFLEDVQFDQTFDVVSCYAILEHLINPRRFFDKLTNIISTKGVLVIMVPSYETFKAWLLEHLHVRWHMYSPPAHLNLYSRRFIDGYLVDRGFTLIRRRYTSGGMFNPVRSVPIVGKAFNRMMWWSDAYGLLLNHVPFFDHMYSYYQAQN